MLGTVKWFSQQRGHGFIMPDGGGDDAFVHYKAIDGDGYRNLAGGDRVRFDLVETPKGVQARNVRRITEHEERVVVVQPEDDLPLPQYMDWRIRE